MRKYESIAFSAAAALTLFLTASCQKEIFQTSEGSASSCTVEFSMNEVTTKTAMGDKDVDNKYHTVWSSDDNARITFYQNGTASQSVAISSADNYKHASFTASFSEQGTAPFTYKAILAGTVTANGLPVVPAEQHPTAGSFDPDANILVGIESEFASKPEKVDLVYKHAAVISRVCFTGIPDGLTIYGVQINADKAIAGAAKSVDYTNGTVDFSDASEKTISLIYDVAPSYSDGKFDAYFVAIPGADVQINDIKLVTDKGTFVKKNSNSSKTGFDVNKLKSVNVTVPSARTFYKATSVESGQNYMIVTASEHALRNNSGSVADKGVTVSDDSIVLSDTDQPSELLWNASDSKNFTLKNGDYSIYYSKSTYGNPSISLSKSNTLSFNYAGTAFTATIDSKEYHLYYNSQGKWSYGTSDYVTNIFTSKLPQGLAYSLSEASYDIAKKEFVGSAPVLTGASGSVTYTSSDTSVATVDSDGNVSVISNKDGDTATITATVEGNALYQSSSASYTLTVIDSNKKYYRKVSIEDLSDLTSGQYLLYSASNKYLFDATQPTAYRKSQGTPTDDKIAQSTDLDELLVTFEEAATSGKYYVKTSKGYLGLSSSSIKFDESKPTEFTISLSNSQISLKTGDYKLRYNSGFSYSNRSQTSAVTFDLYLLDGSKKASRNLVFAESSVSKNLGADAFINTLNGYADGVTFTSTNTNVATVNSTTGLVTVSSSNAGTTTITASAPETETYSAAEVSYTLTVIDPDAVVYYTKVTSALPTSGSWDKVLFVYDNGNGTGYAFKGIYDGDVSKAPGGTTNTNTSYLIEAGNAVQVSITSSGIVSTSEIDACRLTMTFTNEKKHYLYMNEIKADFRMLAGTSNGGKFVVMSSAGYRMTYDVSESGTNNVTASRNDGKTYYFSFNGTNFAGTTTKSSFCIYKLD